MTFTSEKQGTNTYLVYQIGESDTLDSTGLGMLSHNKIKNVAPIIFTQMDADKYFKYNITAKVPLSRFLTGTVTKKRLLGALSSLADGIVDAEEYMLDASMFVLDLDYIFVDTETCDTLLICLPIMNVGRQVENIHDFFKKIVMQTQCDQTENMDYYAKMVSYLNQTTIFSTDNFCTMLKQLTIESSSPSSTSYPLEQRPVAEAQPVRQTVQPLSLGGVLPMPPTPPVVNVQPAPIAQVPYKPVPADVKKISLFHLLMHYNDDNKAAYKAQKQAKTKPSSRTVPQKAPISQGSPRFAIPGVETAMSQAVVEVQSSQPANPPAAVLPPVSQQSHAQAYQTPPQPVTNTRSANFGGTVVLDQNPRKGTTVLGVDMAMPQNTPHLIRIKTNERIDFSGQLLRVGRNKSVVEYCIGDNSAVSNYHADFSAAGGKYFVTDQNSRNHTYVNGIMIQSMKAVELSHGTKIKLADVEFEFRMY